MEPKTDISTVQDLAQLIVNLSKENKRLTEKLNKLKNLCQLNPDTLLITKSAILHILETDLPLY